MSINKINLDNEYAGSLPTKDSLCKLDPNNIADTDPIIQNSKPWYQIHILLWSQEIYIQNLLGSKSGLKHLKAWVVKM